jgi:hypothetical protein
MGVFPATLSLKANLQMSLSRDRMIAELKQIVMPELRSLGFKGTFPHFRRTTDDQVELLTFQFSMGGGQFVVEIGKFPSTGYELYGKLIPAAEVKMSHLLRRLRLGASDEATDHWFHFEEGNCDEVAASIIPYVRNQAVNWWSSA